MYSDKELTIRPVKEEDLPRLWELIFKEENPEWKQWDAPYFPHHTKTLANFLAKKENWIDDEHCWLISVNGVIAGTVSCYYEDAQKQWLEMGIGFYEGTSWGKGLGTRALTLWMNHLFHSIPLVRVGLTTWSGNHRMVRVAEKLGMTMEGRMRKVRYYNGEHFDSIRMGILREEWAVQHA